MGSNEFGATQSVDPYANISHVEMADGSTRFPGVDAQTDLNGHPINPEQVVKGTDNKGNVVAVRKTPLNAEDATPGTPPPGEGGEPAKPPSIQPKTGPNEAPDNPAGASSISETTESANTAKTPINHPDATPAQNAAANDDPSHYTSHSNNTIVPDKNNPWIDRGGQPIDPKTVAEIRSKAAEQTWSVENEPQASNALVQRTAADELPQSSNSTTEPKNTPTQDAAGFRAAGIKVRLGNHAAALDTIAKTLDNSASRWFENPLEFVKQVTAGVSSLFPIRSAVSELAHTKAGEYWRNQQASAAARGDWAAAMKADSAATQVEKQAANLRSARQQGNQYGGTQASTVSYNDISSNQGATLRVNNTANTVLDGAAKRADIARTNAQAQTDQLESRLSFSTKGRNAAQGDNTANASARKAPVAIDAEKQAEIDNIIRNRFKADTQARRHLVPALHAITNVHAFPDLLKKVTVEAHLKSKIGNWSNPNVEGYYDDVSRTAHFAHDGAHPLLSLVHEIGHALHHALFPEHYEHGDTHAGDLAEFVRKLHATDPYKNWKDAKSSDKLFNKRKGTKPFNVESDEIAYALNHRELFARFYAQYIAHKAQHATLGREWNIFRDDGYRTRYQQYWDGQQFDALVYEFEKVLRNRNILKER